MTTLFDDESIPVTILSNTFNYFRFRQIENSNAISQSPAEPLRERERDVNASDDHEMKII